MLVVVVVDLVIRLFFLFPQSPIRREEASGESTAAAGREPAFYLPLACGADLIVAGNEAGGPRVSLMAFAF